MFKAGQLVIRNTNSRKGLWEMRCNEQRKDPSAAYIVVSCDESGLQLKGFPPLPKFTFMETSFSLAEEVKGTDVLTDAVDSPSHYQFFPDVEAIEIIASSLTEEGFHGYCIGNRLKYRLRAGNKDKLEQDIAKSDKYIELYEKHKHLCKENK